MVQQGSILDRTRTPVSDQLEPLVVVDILDHPFDDTLETVHNLPERVVRCGIWLSPSPNPPKGSGHPEEARDERSRLETAWP